VRVAELFIVTLASPSFFSIWASLSPKRTTLWLVAAGAAVVAEVAAAALAPGIAQNSAAAQTSSAMNRRRVGSLEIEQNARMAQRVQICRRLSTLAMGWQNLRDAHNFKSFGKFVVRFCLGSVL
jgi:hypothetical protein